MTQTRLDHPWNWPRDWKTPSFIDGEIPALVMEEGARIVGVERVMEAHGVRLHDPHRVKVGFACHKLAWLFEEYRPEIVEAIRRANAQRRTDGGGDV